MPTKFKFTDEAAAIAFIESLEAEVASLKEQQSAEQQIVRTSEQIVSLTRERDELRAENQRLRESAGSFDKRVASEVARLGIRTQAVDVGSGGKPEMTATEKVLRAKGVSSLEELAALGKKAVAIFVTTLIAMFTWTAHAQDAKAYTLLNGGTNNIVANSTNATIYLNVSEFSEVGVQLSGASTSGSTSNLLVKVFRTVDSDTPESTVFNQLVLPLNGTVTNTAFINFNVGSAASLRLNVCNTNAGGFGTNLKLVARFKASKIKITN